MTSLALRPAVKTTALDVVLCACVLAIPALSHAVAFPLYRLEPMRLLLFVAILASARRNALVMALALPLVSYLTSGHPVAPKFFLIQGELVINTVLFFAIWQRWRRFVPAAVVSVLASKVAYYGAKAVLIQAAMLEGQLISTPFAYQLGVLAIILAGGGLYHLLKNRAQA